jgi:hypothetical protein
MSGPVSADGPLEVPLDVAALAETLPEDPVQVAEVFGNGRTDEVDAALTAVVEDLPFPAYVVLAPGPDGLSTTEPARDLAGRLHERIGGDAVLVVQTEPKSYGMDVVSFGDVPDETEIYGVLQEFFPEGGADAGLHPAGVAARTLDVLGTLDEGGEVTQEQMDSFHEVAAFRDPPEWDPGYGPPAAESVAMWGAFAFVAVAGGAYLLLRNVLRWRATSPAARSRAGRTDRPDRAVEAGLGTPDEVRAAVERELASLSRLLERSAGRDGAGGEGPDLERRALVDGSYDVARSLLERTGSADADLDDLVGALVLVRTATRAAGGTATGRSTRRRRGPRDEAREEAGPATYRPCFFDPRHGEGVARRTVPVGDRELTVPACRPCSHTTGRGLAPMTVRGGLLSRERPWYERDTVWARTGYGAFVDDLWRHVGRALQEER